MNGAKYRWSYHIYFGYAVNLINQNILRKYKSKFKFWRSLFSGQKWISVWNMTTQEYSWIAYKHVLFFVPEHIFGLDSVWAEPNNRFIHSMNFVITTISINTYIFYLIVPCTVLVRNLLSFNKPVRCISKLFLKCVFFISTGECRQSSNKICYY